MAAQLVKRYRQGAKTGHECAIDCLLEIDSDDPGAVLAKLPEEILEAVADSLRDHRSDVSWVSTHGPVPTDEQLNAAQSWLVKVRAAS